MEEKVGNTTGDAHGEQRDSVDGAASKEDPIAALANYLGAFYDSIRWDIALKKDSLRVRLQRSLLYAVFGGIAVCIASALLFSFTFFLVRGVNLALIEMFSAPTWVVYISTSLFFLLLLCATVFLFFKRAQKSLLRQLNEKYEQMREELSSKKQGSYSPGDEVH